MKIRMIQKIISLSVVFLLTVGIAIASPEIPSGNQKTPIALTGATVHTISGKTLVKATVLFEHGKIVAIGTKLKLPPKTEVIDVSGKHIYPSLIETYTDIGLTEINAVRSTRDRAEVGKVNPNVKAQVAFNPDSEMIPVARANGVLLAISSPAGDLFTGQGALMQLDGWTFEDMAVKASTGIYLNFPRMSSVSAWWTKDSSKEQLKRRDADLNLIHKTFDDALAYMKAKAAGAKVKKDLRKEAFIPLFKKQLPLVVAADELLQIRAAVALAQKYQVKLIIVGGYDAPLCAALLKKHQVSVVITGIHRLPKRRSDAYDAPFTVPEKLRAAGVKYCISGQGRFSAAQVRNLPYHAGTAVAYGLSKEEALRAITLYPAQIFEVADKVGSLEKGKFASLIVTDGDILETPTNVTMAFIQGRKVDLSNRHKRLWKKYRQKYRQQEELKKNNKK